MQPEGIFVLVQMTAGGPASAALELLALARQLASDRKELVSAIVVDHTEPPCTSELFAHGADRVFVARDAAQPQAHLGYLSDTWVSLVQEVLRSVSPRCILIAHNDLGAEVGPRLAFRLGASIATGCERVDNDGDQIVVTRPCFGNKAREVLTLKKGPAIVTVRPHISEPLQADPERRGEVVEVSVPGAQHATRVLERKVESGGETIRLEAARVVVAGGRGLGGAQGFEMLQQMASQLGGAVGASRVACDLDWCPRSWQIGLSGKTVAPDLYIAVGISGAGQHMAGCSKAKTIVAINADPDAPIFNDATLGIVGDYREVVPSLLKEISRRSAIAEPAP